MPAPPLYPVYAVDGILGRECSQCHAWKPVTEFHKARKEKAGIMTCCKECKYKVYGVRQTAKGYWRDYYAANRERRIIEAKDWEHKKRPPKNPRPESEEKRRKRETTQRPLVQLSLVPLLSDEDYRRHKRIVSYHKNKKRYNACTIAWHRRNRAHFNAYLRAWHINNPERSKQIRDRALKKNWAKRKLAQHRRRTAEGVFTQSDLLAILKDQQGRCYYCDLPLQAKHIEHKMPVSRGGTNWPHNLCYACPSCNCRKGALTEEEFKERFTVTELRALARR